MLAYLSFVGCIEITYCYSGFQRYTTYWVFCRVKGICLAKAMKTPLEPLKGETIGYIFFS